MDALIHFIHMDGYGVYVWSAYGITLFGLLGHYYLARKQLKKACYVASTMSSRDIGSKTRTITFRKMT